MQQCIEAEQAGLHEAFIGEHATMRWESVPNPELGIAAAALETERITMGPLAHLLPYHNSASLANPGGLDEPDPQRGATSSGSARARTPPTPRYAGSRTSPRTSR